MNMELGIGNTQLFWWWVVHTGTAIPECNLMIQGLYLQ